MVIAIRSAALDLHDRKRGVRNYSIRISTMDLTVWLPALFLLGLAGMGLMFAFVIGCERV
jgi:hypothetical protein